MRITPAAIFKSIRVKFGLIVLALLSLVFTLSTSVLIFRNIETQTKNLVNQARAFAQLSAQPIGDTYSLYYDSGYLKFTELMRKILSLNQDITRVQIVSVTGEILFDSKNLASERSTQSSGGEVSREVVEKVGLNEASEIPTRTEDSRPQEIIEPYFEDFGAHPFSIRYFVSYDLIARNIMGIITTSVLLSAIFLAISVVLIYLVVGRLIINPLEIVIGGAKQIQEGNFSHNIQVKNKDEIGDLAVAVNEMAQTLKRNIEDLKELDKLKDEFVYLASHNLRTPVTVIKGYLANLKESKSLDKVAKEKLARIEFGAKELETLAESLLNIVSLERKEKPLLLENVDLASLVEELVESFKKEAFEKKIRFILEMPAGKTPEITADKIRIKQAIENIINNSIKFNRIGGRVTIKLEKRNSEILLSVQDTGIGIPKEQEKHIFEKFYRATSMLVYEYEGIGLGLYASRLIIEAHRGKIWFTSTPGKGTTFFISLPARAKDSKG